MVTATSTFIGVVAVTAAKIAVGLARIMTNGENDNEDQINALIAS